MRSDKDRIEIFGRKSSKDLLPSIDSIPSTYQIDFERRRDFFYILIYS